jgi:hypothetical protein
MAGNANPRYPKSTPMPSTRPGTGSSAAIFRTRVRPTSTSTTWPIASPTGS